MTNPDDIAGLRHSVDELEDEVRVLRESVDDLYTTIDYLVRQIRRELWQALQTRTEEDTDWESPLDGHPINTTDRRNL